MQHCTNCGAAVDGASACPTCGVDLTTNDAGKGTPVACPDGGRPNDTDQTVAGILAILLGWLGAHKFYQGNMKLGVIYLCFFWTTIPSLLGLIEGILMLVADEDEYYAKYADGSILGK